jgi:NRAMP (natural resistance-associated macrophage protein)-like metal ion transporter
MNQVIMPLKSTLNKLTNIGPASLVTAAFIGPGTIATCSLAGSSFGFALLWGLTFSVIATVVLQEMTARLGIVTQKGLGESIREQLKTPLVKVLAVILILAAIVIGNAAYETGNLVGAALGVSVILPGVDARLISLFIGGIAFAVLITGSYKLLERVLIALVLLMSVVFVSTAVVIGPELLAVLKGVLVPSLPKGSTLMIIGLIGTTVVPYNLFLHASAVKERWKKSDDLNAARFDVLISVIMGGIISMSIVITSAVAFYGSGITLQGAGDLAIQLEPVLGNWAKYLLAFGLFAAGISSTITAPLAASYAACGIMGWPVKMNSWRFKIVWMVILGIGLVFASMGYRPLEAILFAQVTNGLLLPVIALFLVVVMNNKTLLGKHANTVYANMAGVVVVIVTLILGVKSILGVF